MCKTFMFYQTLKAFIWRNTYANVNSMFDVSGENHDSNNASNKQKAMLVDILEKMGYRETEEHAMIHRQLIAKAVRLSVRFEENKLDFGEIFNFLANDVVIEHMLKTDRKYFPFLPQARH